MRRKNNFLVLAAVLFIMLPGLFMGCGGGGGGGDDGSGSDSAAGISVTPESYDFGVVTPGNPPEPLTVVIANNGTEGLTIEHISLTDNDNYELYYPVEDGCNSGAATLFPENQCTVGVEFVRTENGGPLPAELKIESDDPVYPVFSVNLEGSVQDINELHVRINQIETGCDPWSGDVSAYVSVTDQGGWPVTNIIEDGSFSLFEDGGDSFPPDSVSSVAGSDATVLAVALAMDYSDSITNIKDSVDDMEESVKSFIDQMGGSDVAKIFKFADDVKGFPEEFTSVKRDLKDSVDSDFEGKATDLYAAVQQAVQETKAFQGEDANIRKAVVVVTDGSDKGTDSNVTKSAVIQEAQEKDVPVFTIGIGDRIDLDVLRDMANKTGGQYYEAGATDNLKNIYRNKIAPLLFEGQYILTYNSDLVSGESAELRVRAELLDIDGYVFSTEDTEETKTIIPCPK